MKEKEMAKIDKKDAYSSFLSASESELHKMKGFDPVMHRSQKVVDEFVEEQNGEKVVIYRTKPELAERARRRYPINIFSPSL